MRGKILLGVVSFVLTMAAHADEPAKAEPHQDCFRMSDWRGWRASGTAAMYFRIGIHDVFRVELSSSAYGLDTPFMHLVSQVRGGDSVCGPVDLDLKLADQQGFAQPLFIKSIRKLSPEEIATIPEKERP